MPTAKQFRVMALTLGEDLRRRITGFEYDPSIYELSDAPTCGLLTTVTRTGIAEPPAPRARHIVDGDRVVLLMGRNGVSPGTEAWVSNDRGATWAHNIITGAGSVRGGMWRFAGAYWMIESLTPSIRSSTDGATWTTDSTTGFGDHSGIVVARLLTGERLYTYGKSSTSLAIRRRNGANSFTSLGDLPNATQQVALCAPIPGTDDFLAFFDPASGGTVGRYALETLSLINSVASLGSIGADVIHTTIGALDASRYFVSTGTSRTIKRTLNGGTLYGDTTIPIGSGYDAGELVRAVDFTMHRARVYALIYSTDFTLCGLFSIADGETTWRVECVPAAGGIVAGTMGLNVAGTLDAYMIFKSGNDFQIWRVTVP